VATIFKIILTVVILIYIKSCITKITAEKLPEELPTELPKIDLSKIKLPEFLKSQEEKKVAEKKDTTDRISVPHKATTSRDSGCVEVVKPFGKSMVESAAEIKHMERPVNWVVANNSAMTLAIVVEQYEKVVALAYIGPMQRYKAKIPSDGISFNVKSSKGSCINWKRNEGVQSKTPKLSQEIFKGNHKKIAVIKTDVTPTSTGLDVETRFSGLEDLE
jgi:hypothetical protein